MAWPTATSAFCWPRRWTKRLDGAPPSAPCWCLAAHAAWTSAARTARRPGVVFPRLRLPAESWWPGHRPAQRARCLALGQGLLATPLAATLRCAPGSATPGSGSRRFTASATQGTRAWSTAWALVSSAARGEDGQGDRLRARAWDPAPSQEAARRARRPSGWCHAGSLRRLANGLAAPRQLDLRDAADLKEPTPTRAHVHPWWRSPTS
jgi:hypothetical protein